MNIVRYAGFDPDEDNFDGVDPAPLHPEELIPPRRVIRTRIDLDRVAELKRLGRSWNEIGRLVAIEEGRRMPYNGNSVKTAALYGVQIDRRSQ